MPDVDNLPVFTHPYEQITFYADDPSTHKQILTILNPYEFQVKFKVLVATVGNVRRYSVNIPSGIIKPHHAADIVLKHLNVTSHNVGVLDRVRVHMSSHGTFRAVGRKDVTVTLLETTPRGRGPEHPSDAELFEQLEVDPASLPHLRQHPLIHERQNNNKFIYIAILLLGSLILAMPKEGDFSEYFPSFFPRPSSEMKFMITFLLGVISCLLLQS